MHKQLVCTAESNTFPSFYIIRKPVRFKNIFVIKPAFDSPIEIWQFFKSFQKSTWLRANSKCYNTNRKQFKTKLKKARYCIIFWIQKGGERCDDQRCQWKVSDFTGYTSILWTDRCDPESNPDKRRYSKLSGRWS